MAWLFFIDESGHDHIHMPYEVRGGVAIHVGQLWSFVQAMQRLELDCFGCRLEDYGKEIKGATLIDRKRFAFARQDGAFSDRERRSLCQSFLAQGRYGGTPSRDAFTAYGQACLCMAREILALLRHHRAVLMASAIPRGITRPRGHRFEDYLRKDAVFLFERFFYFLEARREHGVLVMDETDKREDRRFVARIERYFSRTELGRQRTAWIVPTPFFVSSDMACAVQAADLCIYAVNWGFRLPGRGMDAPQRDEIADMFGTDLAALQYRGQGVRAGRAFDTYGIFHVPDPYEPRPAP